MARKSIYLFSLLDNFFDDSRRRSERAGIMEKPPIPNFKARISTAIFEQDEVGGLRSGSSLPANAATPHIAELISG